MTSFIRMLRLAVRFALREMRGGLSGFMIFVACIALGVAAIGGGASRARVLASCSTLMGAGTAGSHWPRLTGRC